LTVTNTFAVLRLLPSSDRDKDTEILVLRHQIAVLERHLGGRKVRFTRADRALLAALLHRLRPEALRRMRLLIRPDTVLRWHRDLIAGPSTVWEILKEAGIDPAPDRAAGTWAGFLRSQADGLLACDFLETVTLSGARMFVLAVIEHHSRRIRVLGATAHPCASWVTQAARNLVMDLHDAGCQARFLIRDRDGKFPQLFDAVLADAGIEVVLTGVRMPRMNAIMERWIQTCRRELLDRTLVWNQDHLLRTLREFEAFYNSHRPHRGIANARPLCPLPPPITDPDQIARLDIRRRPGLGGILNTYEHAA
jgi:transposase InsO family protein